MNAFVYRVEMLDDVNKSTRESCGVTFAGSYTEAMQNIEASYQPELISVELLCEIDEQHTLELPREVMEAILNDEY